MSVPAVRGLVLYFSVLNVPWVKQDMKMSNVMLREGKDRATNLYMLVLRTLDRVGVLYTCTRVVAEAGVNIVSAHVIPVRYGDRRETNIVLFVNRLPPDVVEQLRQLDFVQDLRVYTLSIPEDSTGDVVLLPVVVLQEAMKSILETYGEAVYGTLFHKLGYLQGKMLASEHFGCSPFEGCATAQLRLTTIFNILRAVNLIRDFKIQQVDQELLEICVKDPVELRGGRGDLPCHYTRGLVQGICEHIFGKGDIVDLKILSDGRTCCMYVKIR